MDRKKNRAPPLSAAGHYEHQYTHQYILILFLCRGSSLQKPLLHAAGELAVAQKLRREETQPPLLADAVGGLC
jgi:hypothetical protein